MLSEIAKFLRAMQFYAHVAHNYVKGPLFLQDHEFLSSLYKEYEQDYDLVVERIIGLNLSCNLEELHKQAILLLNQLPFEVKENKEYFSAIISLELKLLSLIEQAIKTPISEGTRQLIGDLANKSEKRLYFLRQRIK